MEFLQVPETPAPEPMEMLEMQEECPETQTGAASVLIVFLSGDVKRKLCNACSICNGTKNNLYVC